MFKRYLKSEQMKKKIRKNFFRRGNFRQFLSKNVLNLLKIKLFLRGDLIHFMRKSIQIWDYFFPLVSPLIQKM